MRWIERFDLFLFDLDGLLVDTESLHFFAYQTLCKKYGYEIPWSFSEYLAIAHSSAEGLKEALFPHLQEKGMMWDDLYREKKTIYLDLVNRGEVKLMPGVETLLQTLAGSQIKRCVVTHSSKEQVALLKHFLPILKTIPVWITREDYEEPKPAPDAYYKAIDLLADAGDQIIGFEDSYRGFSALKKTEAFPVLICPENHPQLKKDALNGVAHYVSFNAIPHSLRPRKI